MKTRIRNSFLLGVVLSVLVLGAGSFPASAATETERLQIQIDERNARLDEIEKEIAGYEKALNEVGAERSTLEKAINTLELERKKVLADISYTQNQISSTDLEISKLTLEIGSTYESIQDHKAAIADIVRALDQNEQETLVEVLLTHDNLSDFWNTFTELDIVNQAMRDRSQELLAQQAILEDKKLTEAERKEQLTALKSRYDGQRAVLQQNKNEKAELLSSTKSEEARYQEQLQAKLDAREKLKQEVQNIEQALQYAVDPTTIPTAGTSVFQWPLDNIVITQRFGYTKFALSGAYGGSQHNGTDFGAPTGTPIKAPLTGTIRSVGNTDAVPGCYSWGKWMLIDHPNGLSSMFAHMSAMNVSPGQQVKAGEIVGYVGSTGYSTGPHLHYTLYISDAVSVKQFNQFKSVTGCGAALSPFAAIEGYLDPLDYLPAL